MGIFDSMKKFRALSPFVEVEVGGGELLLKFHRLTPEEENRVNSLAAAGAHSAGEGPLTLGRFTLEHNYQMWKALRGKLTGWEHKPAEGDAIPFNEVNAANFFSSRSLDEQIALVAAYSAAAHPRQAEGNDSSETDSSTPSKDESKSGQETKD